MAASIATKINIHLCRRLFTLLCVTVSPWTSPFLVQAQDDRARTWCAWLPWISRWACTIWRPCWKTAWRQWKHSIEQIFQAFLYFKIWILHVMQIYFIELLNYFYVTVNKIFGDTKQLYIYCPSGCMLEDWIVKGLAISKQFSWNLIHVITMTYVVMCGYICVHRARLCYHGNHIC